LKDAVNDLKLRSIRNNLNVTGIPEERGEDTEAVL
jgi:hypothetical protein